MQAILIIGDGMADRPIDEPSYQTPLEAAELRAITLGLSLLDSHILVSDALSPNVKFQYLFDKLVR